MVTARATPGNGASVYQPARSRRLAGRLHLAKRRCRLARRDGIRADGAGPGTLASTVSGDSVSKREPREPAKPRHLAKKRGSAAMPATRARFREEARAFPSPMGLAAEASFWRELFLVQINQHASEDSELRQGGLESGSPPTRSPTPALCKTQGCRLPAAPSSL